MSDRSIFTEKDYNHLNTERTQAKLLIQQTQKAPNARKDLMNGNKNVIKNTNVYESVNETKNETVDSKSTHDTDFGSLAKKLKKSSAAKRKPKFDETQSRDSVWIRNDLKKY